MIFTPEKYKIADEKGKPFIDADELWQYMEDADATKENVEFVIQKALNKNRLSLEDVAILVKTTDPDLIVKIKEAATILKEVVYGNRIVLFAPLYVGNLCNNNCKYCGFRASNKEAQRSTLTKAELVENVKALLDNGHKRLILVYGEHQLYDPQFIADTVRTVYDVRSGNSRIRRVNINAAPLDIDGFGVVRDSGIGTYQVFQESYHPEAYKKYHQGGKKANFLNRQTALDKAQEAGLDDVGIGALFGLYDWRYEVLGLIRHVNHLESCYNIGPHTISFPRLQDAADFKVDEQYRVNDEDFTKLVAILRLAVPYTGLILTARESEAIRDEVLQYGCSQVDAGTRIEMNAYAENGNGSNQNLSKEQFLINDNRSLNEVIDELIKKDHLPSFCTACYRLGRTGEHFMEFSVPGFIKNYCTPNALLTLSEYVVDYAEEETARKAWKHIDKHIAKLNNEKLESRLKKRIERIKDGERDLYF